MSLSTNPAVKKITVNANMTCLRALEQDSDTDVDVSINASDDKQSLHGRTGDPSPPRKQQLQQQQQLQSQLYEEKVDDDDIDRSDAIYACIFASAITKKASELAYASKNRAMTTPDVIENIGAAFQLLYHSETTTVTTSTIVV